MEPILRLRDADDTNNDGHVDVVHPSVIEGIRKRHVNVTDAIDRNIQR